MTTDCVCLNCFLYHPKKDYCSLDGLKHAGCMINFMPILPESNIEEGEL